MGIVRLGQPNLLAPTLPATTVGSLVTTPAGKPNVIQVGDIVFGSIVSVTFDFPFKTVPRVEVNASQQGYWGSAASVTLTGFTAYMENAAGAANSTGNYVAIGT